MVYRLSIEMLQMELGFAASVAYNVITGAFTGGDREVVVGVGRFFHILVNGSCRWDYRYFLDVQG